MALIFCCDGAAGTADVSTNLTSVLDGPTSGIVTVDTTAAKHHGFGALKHDSGASASAYRAKLAVLADAGRRTSVWYRYDGFPSGSSTGVLRAMTSASAQVGQVVVDSTGHLRLQAGASGTTLLATGTTVLNLGQWYRIALCYTITSASVSEWRVYLDGNLELTASNPASQVTASSILRVGWTGTSPGANVIMYSSDYYVDDSTALTDPGNIWVTGKVPASLGSSNGFGVLTGTGTNRWDYVSERPVNTANRISQTATAQATEEFGVQAASAGDDDITGATIAGWGGWCAFTVVAAAGSTLAQIIVNAVLQSTTTTAASGVYQALFRPSAVTTYPSTDAIGLRSTGSTVDTSLAECGVLIAYIPAAGPTAPFPPFHPQVTQQAVYRM